MPMVKGKLLTPDEAIEQDLCPECGVSLLDQNPIGHRNTHWLTQPRNDKRGTEALRRIALFDEYIRVHNVKTSNAPLVAHKPAHRGKGA